METLNSQPVSTSQGLRLQSPHHTQAVAFVSVEHTVTLQGVRCMVPGPSSTAVSWVGSRLVPNEAEVHHSSPYTNCHVLLSTVSYELHIQEAFTQIQIGSITISEGAKRNPAIC